MQKKEIIMHFEFSTVNRIFFGEGSIQEISSQSDKIGECILVVTGKSQQRAVPLLEILDKLEKKIEIFHVPDPSRPEGTEPPEKCPSCRHPREYYEPECMCFKEGCEICN